MNFASTISWSMQKVNKTLTFGLEKRIKERKNTYGGSPNANLDQNGSGMKQRFQLRALDQIVWVFATKGGGIYRKSITVRIVYRISCHDRVRTLVKNVVVTENGLWPLIGWKGIAPWSNERPTALIRNIESGLTVWRGPPKHLGKTHAGRLAPSDLHQVSEITVLVPVACLSHFRHF